MSFLTTRGGASLEAVRKGNLKFYPKTLDVYNIMRDPREQFSDRRRYLWLMEPMRNMIQEHKKMMKEFPNRILSEKL